MNLRFEWDARKALTNRMKHGISFEEAMTVFNDPLARIFDDSDHSMTESREIIFGVSQKQRRLLVCFPERRKAVRIISARKANKLECQDFEEAHSS
jgi:uncharacterized protein